MPTKKQKTALLVARQFPISPLKNPWLALRAAKEKIAHADDNFQKNLFMVELYTQARTYFEQDV